MTGVPIRTASPSGTSISSSATADPIAAVRAAAARGAMSAIQAARSASDVDTDSSSPARRSVRTPRGSRMRCATSIRSWCASFCIATTMNRAPNRHAAVSTRNSRRQSAQPHREGEDVPGRDGPVDDHADRDRDQRLGHLMQADQDGADAQPGTIPHQRATQNCGATSLHARNSQRRRFPTHQPSKQTLTR